MRVNLRGKRRLMVKKGRRLTKNLWKALKLGRTEKVRKVEVELMTHLNDDSPRMVWSSIKCWYWTRPRLETHVTKLEDQANVVEALY